MNGQAIKSAHLYLQTEQQGNLSADPGFVDFPVRDLSGGPAFQP